MAANWSPSGVYAAGTATGVLLGDLKTPEPYAEVALIEPGDPWMITHISWDGEAFAVHLDGPDNNLAVARIDERGHLLLPLTPYGNTPGPGIQPDGHRIVTDPTSGITYVGDGLKSLYLNGHRRDGSSLWGGRKEVLQDASIYSPVALGADPEGAFVLTNPRKYKLEINPPRVFRVSTDGSVSGPWLLPIPEGEAMREEFAVASESATRAWFTVNSGMRLYMWEMIDGQVGPRRVLIDTGLPAGEASKNIPDYYEYNQHFSPFVRAYTFGTERWVVLYEEGKPEAPSRLRLLRVDDPTCTYPPRKRYQP